MRNRFPRFFLTTCIVVVQNVLLRMIDMVSGCDLEGVHLEGCVHAQPEVAQCSP